jgi:hypothetical protein
MAQVEPESIGCKNRKERKAKGPIHPASQKIMEDWNNGTMEYWERQSPGGIRNSRNSGILEKWEDGMLGKNQNQKGGTNSFSSFPSIPILMVS